MRQRLLRLPQHRLHIASAGKKSNALATLRPVSLGSQILFDAYRQVRGSDIAKARALVPMGGIHLVSNQVLSRDQVGFTDAERQKNRSATDASWSSSLLDEIETSQTAELTADRVGPIHVPFLANVDPNDVLGHRVFEDQNPDADHFEIFNVVLSDPGTAVALVPIVSNPGRAHRGAKDNDAIFGIIIEGADLQNPFH